MQPQINWDTVKNFMHEKTDYKDEKISVSGRRRQLHHYLQLEVVFKVEVNHLVLPEIEIRHYLYGAYVSQIGQIQIG